MFKRGELPRRFMARKLFGWSDKRYNQEDWRGIGDGGKESNQGKEKWKQS